MYFRSKIDPCAIKKFSLIWFKRWIMRIEPEFDSSLWQIKLTPLFDRHEK